MSTLVTAAAALLAGCAERNPATGPLGTAAAPSLNTLPGAPPPVRVAELHYDNMGPDAFEAVEISGPAGTSIAGWSVVLYDGGSGTPYASAVLSGTIPASCGTRGVVVASFPTTGIQDGSPDGVALVDQTGTLIEFLSYEGSFTGVVGAANGRTSTDIGVFEMGFEPPGQSLQRSGRGPWNPPRDATFGACNDNDAPAPPANTAPVARTDGPYTLLEGSSVSMSAAASTDAENEVLTFAWNFGDGTTGTGVSASHVYAQDGSYTVTLTVTDARGLSHATTTTATVNNVAPSIAGFGGANLLPGESYGASGSFADPGSDPWSATVDYGAGASQSLPLNGKSFALSHTYSTAGTFTVIVRVRDDDVTSAKTEQVVVLSHSEGVQATIGMLDELVGDGNLNAGLANALRVRLQAVRRQLQMKNNVPARQQLQAIRIEVDQLVQVGHLTSDDAEPLISALDRLISSMG